MQEAYIISTARTPLGRFGGTLANCSPVELGTHTIQAVLKQAGISGEALDLYVFGNVLRAGHGQSLPRQAALKAGIPESVNGYAVDMVCSSAMMSVINATTAIHAQAADIVLAGGMESMSQTGFLLSHRARWGYKSLSSPEQLIDILLYDGLTDPTSSETMGEQAERLASTYNITRAELDEVALYSHQRAAIATHKERSNAKLSRLRSKARRECSLSIKMKEFAQKAHWRASASSNPRLSRMASLQLVTAVNYQMEPQRWL